MHWAVLRVSIMFRNSIPVFVQYHLLISLDSVQVRFLAHPKTTSLALAHVHNMATLALKLSGRSLLYSKSASWKKTKSGRKDKIERKDKIGNRDLFRPGGILGYSWVFLFRPSVWEAPMSSQGRTEETLRHIPWKSLPKRSSQEEQEKFQESPSPPHVQTLSPINS